MAELSTETSADVLALERAVAGRYALERELGRGGMGVVLLARDLSLDRLVALKLLPALLAAQPLLRERFLREARTAAGLSHPHIVPIHAVEEHEGIAFIAMAFVDGETLADRVRRTGPLPPHEVARILREVAWALAYAHGRGIVHRDIKPDNILIERGSGRALVTDFGIARARSGPGVTDRLTLEGQLLGTASFMSPEQGAGEHVDGRSDLYSLGSVGFYALTGRAPFEATTLEAILVARFTRAAPAVASIRPDVPTALAVTIDRCLAREPHDRFASGEAVADALSEGTGIAGTQEVAPPVRSFLRNAEQTLWLASLVVVFTLIYGLPTTRRIVPLLIGIAFGGFIVSIDLFRRARELIGEGFDAGDVRRGFAIEKQAHAEEMRRLFDARRTAARRRLGRRAWGVFAIGVVIRIATQWAFMHRAPGMRGALVPIMIVTDLSNTVSLVIGLNASPRAERRMFRLAAWMWQSRFARGFFWLAGIGRVRPEKRGRGPNADTPSYRLIDLAPATVKSAYPDLPDLLKRLDATQAGLRLREAEVARALTESGGGRIDAQRLDGDQARETSSGGFTTPSERLLEDRRVVLLGEMRDALQSTRARRATIAAALENVRIQLLRVGAGVGAADDMREELAALRRLAEDADGAVMNRAPRTVAARAT
jgi:eukaryotic-like serine/threonine-protein kinase